MILSIILAICIIIIAILLAAMPWKKDTDQTDAAQTFTGTIACLPKPGNGPHTMECAMGLQTDDDTYYALKNNPKPETAVNTHVRVKGIVGQPTNNESYDIDGTIDVESFAVIK